MRLVIQRVKSTSVNVRGKVVGSIKKGIFVLVGVEKDDTEKDAEKLAEKLSKLRVMADKKGKMNLSINDVAGKILIVSQFTLHADTTQGNRPSFLKSAFPRDAERIYKHFIEYLKNLGLRVETGKFGAYMKINLELDGPVTILLDSKSKL